MVSVSVITRRDGHINIVGAGTTGEIEFQVMLADLGSSHTVCVRRNITLIHLRHRPAYISIYAANKCILFALILGT
jgi:hypothetical protein